MDDKSQFIDDIIVEQSVGNAVLLLLRKHGGHEKVIPEMGPELDVLVQRAITALGDMCREAVGDRPISAGTDDDKKSFFFATTLSGAIDLYDYHVERGKSSDRALELAIEFIAEKYGIADTASFGITADDIELAKQGLRSHIFKQRTSGHGR